jgi:uncharacterized lipoprotein YddW (UPF0748 family)
MQKALLALLFTFLCGATFAQRMPKRELRGAWIATYLNIDWPNRTQTPEAQRAALLAILDHHKATGINALYIQVRSQCDALYPSNLEPWTADLTGTQGKDPGWDPMQFAIDECHKRGMEFHAWMNPYRAAGNATQLPGFAPNHVTKVHPEWLLSQGNLRVLDPGIPAVRDYVTAVIEDVLTRYDIDGLHFDDYFYPPAAPLGTIPYNDDATYAADPRGFTDRGDWRRDNVSLLIKRLSETVNTLKPWIKFGISPTGIYRNSTNPEIGSNTRGLEHYATLYADSRKWLREGWIDYLAPQVYWWIGQPGADYGIVTPWWNNQAYGRHIYIGLAGYKVNDPAQGVNWANPSQIPNQVRMNRSADYPNLYGQAVYNTSSLRSTTRLGFRDSLRNDFYRRPVLLPAMPWRDNQAPAAPAGLAATRNADGTTVLTWTPPAATDNPFDQARQFAVYRAETPALDVAGGTHLVAVTAVGATSFTDTPPVPGATYFYQVTALDRFHNESTPSNVTDYDAPVVVLPPTQTLTLDNACAATLPDYRGLATVTDDVTPVEAITFTQSPAAGAAVAGTSPVTVTFTATDASGKTTTASFAVTPQDVTPPVVLARNLTRALRNGAVTITAADIDNGSSDNCGLDLSTFTVSPASFNCTNIGPNTVTLSVRDGSGNLASATATVTVTGAVPQVAVALGRTDATPTRLPANTIALGYGAQELTLTATDGTSAGSTFAWSPAAGLSNPGGAVTRFIPTAPGLYTFAVQATNPNGCTGTASVTVRVIDARCGDLNDKVIVCARNGAKGAQVCVDRDAVPALLEKWGSLDGCRPANQNTVAGRLGEGEDGAGVLTASPNPFVREVTVSFRLPDAETHAVLDVYDGQGRQAGRLYAGAIEAGRTYRFAVSADRLPGRFLVARLVTAGKVYHYKLIKMN